MSIFTTKTEGKEKAESGSEQLLKDLVDVIGDLSRSVKAIKDDLAFTTEQVAVLERKVKDEDNEPSSSSSGRLDGKAGEKRKLMEGGSGPELKLHDLRHTIGPNDDGLGWDDLRHLASKKDTVHILNNSISSATEKVSKSLLRMSLSNIEPFTVDNIGTWKDRTDCKLGTSNLAPEFTTDHWRICVAVANSTGDLHSIATAAKKEIIDRELMNLRLKARKVHPERDPTKLCENDIDAAAVKWDEFISIIRDKLINGAAGINVTRWFDTSRATNIKNIETFNETVRNKSYYWNDLDTVPFGYSKMLADVLTAVELTELVMIGRKQVATAKLESWSNSIKIINVLESMFAHVNILAAVKVNMKTTSTTTTTGSYNNNNKFIPNYNNNNNVNKKVDRVEKKSDGRTSKYLTEKERAEYRTKKLCFKCGGADHISRNCPK